MHYQFIVTSRLFLAMALRDSDYIYIRRAESADVAPPAFTLTLYQLIPLSSIMSSQ